jgi:hypothetical protein
VDIRNKEDCNAYREDQRHPYDKAMLSVQWRRRLSQLHRKRLPKVQAIRKTRND